MKITDSGAKKRAGNIKLVIMDVDGVMTDGRIVIDDNGVESKFFHVRDGHGIKLLIRAGVRVAIITGRESHVVSRRARELGIDHVSQGVIEKAKRTREIIEELGLLPKEVAFIGDDLIDIPAMRIVGLAAAVADSVPEVKKFAHIITENGGGKGAVREVCEYILKAKRLWEEITEKYLK